MSERRPQALGRPADGRPPVLLLHGLARTRLSLAGMDRVLRRAGHKTLARTYPSRRASVQALADVVAGWVHEAFGDGEVDVVSHSLGGVLTRVLSEQVRLRRVVMLAPPNAGSDVARALAGLRPFEWLYGPAGRDVAAAEGWPHALGAEVGVIAGTRSPSIGNPVSWITSGVFKGDRPNDGTVAVDETRLVGMTDFVTVDASHTWIMNDPRVQQMVLHFLAHGRFAAGDGSAPGAPPGRPRP